MYHDFNLAKKKRIYTRNIVPVLHYLLNLNVTCFEYKLHNYFNIICKR